MKTFSPSRSTGTGKPEVASFFDQRTFSVPYVVSNPITRQCAFIDSVLDVDEKSGATATHTPTNCWPTWRTRGPRCNGSWPTIFTQPAI